MYASVNFSGSLIGSVKKEVGDSSVRHKNAVNNNNESLQLHRLLDSAEHFCVLQLTQCQKGNTTHFYGRRN